MDKGEPTQGFGIRKTDYGDFGFGFAGRVRRTGASYESSGKKHAFEFLLPRPERDRAERIFRSHRAYQRQAPPNNHMSVAVHLTASERICRAESRFRRASFRSTERTDICRMVAGTTTRLVAFFELWLAFLFKESSIITYFIIFYLNSSKA